MTRLEQQDAYRTEFEDRLVEAVPDGSAAWWRLASSLFYPTSGGQPFDTGELRSGNGRWRVVEVALRRDAVWHRVEGVPAAPGGAELEPPEVGRAISGRIDWPRRFRHMQRHTAQHLLSQAFLRIDPGFETRSVSLAGPDCTLDLLSPDGSEALDAAAPAAEELVNEVASRALPIRTFEIDEGELGGVTLRRPPKVRGRIRVVEMGSWERSACGGTHLRSTAEALPVLLTGVERVHGGSARVTFRAGLEAVERASATQRAASAAATRLSTRIAELPGRVEALLEEAAAARRAAAEARQGWAEVVAQALLAAPAAVAQRTRGSGAAAPAAASGAAAVVTHALPAGEAALAEPLADALASRGVSAAVGAAVGERVRLVLATGAGVDVRPALREALAVLEGRGGGRPERAQGAGSRPERLDLALARAAERLRAEGRAAE